jgi:hypothetical protein
MQWFVNLMEELESNVWWVIRQRFEQPTHENKNMIGGMRTYFHPCEPDQSFEIPRLDVTRLGSSLWLLGVSFVSRGKPSSCSQSVKSHLAAES